MSQPQPKYWFPAKRYGWGWGLPTCWQGWLVFGTYLALGVAGSLLLAPKADPAGFLAFMSVITAGLIIVCWWKGEPPRWRWGGD